MRTTTWNVPITVEDPETGLRRTVKTVRQAQTLLNRNWPTHDGSRYHAAERACETALRDGSAGNDCRRAFIAAAIEAHLHLS